MRTVHETEALRPSDPVPKHHSSNPQNKAQRLRLTLKGLAPANGTNGSVAEGSAPGSIKEPLSAVKSNASNPNSPGLGPNGPSQADIEYEHNNVVYEQDGNGEWIRHFPSDIQFSAHEIRLGPEALHAVLRAQVMWAQEEGDALRVEVEGLEGEREREWVRKEMLVENVMEAEFAESERRNGIHETVRPRMQKDAEYGRKLDIPGSEKLWWRHANGAVEEPAGEEPPVES